MASPLTRARNPASSIFTLARSFLNTEASRTCERITGECLKMVRWNYHESPSNIATLMGKMKINNGIWGYPIFKQTDFVVGVLSPNIFQELVSSIQQYTGLGITFTSFGTRPPRICILKHPEYDWVCQNPLALVGYINSVCLLATRLCSSPVSVALRGGT